MFTEGVYKAIIKKWKFDTFGYISVAMFLIALLSGVILAVSYEVGDPEKSISLLLLSNPAASFIRNIHYWGAQFFLIFTLLHIWEHLIISSERKLKIGIWFRLAAALFVALFVMITGFILKGDSDSAQALRIVDSLIRTTPLLGNMLGDVFIGSGGYELIYVHHIATASIFLFIIIFEHSKVIWGKPKTFFYSLLLIVFLSIQFTPLLKTEFDPIVRGPWYFLGLQELLHYLSEPVWAVLLMIILISLFGALPILKEKLSQKLKSGLIFFSILYFGITLFVFLLRGENWEPDYSGTSEYSTNFEYGVFNPFSRGTDSTLTGAFIGERYEGCVVCHSDVSGFSSAHSTAALGCYSCHRGNPFTLSKSQAHKSMILIPGNLSNSRLSCGSSNCHPGIQERVEGSLMNRLTGMIGVNRFVFDENKTPDDSVSVYELTDSPADTHLRQLCVSCHIGNEKEEYGGITRLSRGGGCNACHLNYSASAEKELTEYSLKTGKHKFHPSLDLNITDQHCFGCHSRSGRISLNYKGLHETQLNPEEVDDTLRYGILEDERVVEVVQADVHYESGLSCIDCHISNEVMGDGKKYLHKEQQSVVRCEDCHGKSLNTLSYENFSDEERKIFDLRGYREFGDTVLSTSQGKNGILNTFKSGNNKFLITKLSGKKLSLKEPANICVEGKAHENVSCSACHSSWAPQCIGCHTEYFPNEKSIDHLTGKEMEGKWVEFAGVFFAEPPVLGVREENGANKIIPFVPGMVLTIERKDGTGKTFQRLYSPVSPHTTIKSGRSCQSCHLNPLAVGYGRGELIVKTKGRNAAIEFIPEYADRIEDDLPEDAWIGFLSEPHLQNSTRSNTRAFNLNEQRKILSVGVCLNCHSDDKDIVQSMLVDFENVKSRISGKCASLSE